MTRVILSPLVFVALLSLAACNVETAGTSAGAGADEQPPRPRGVSWQEIAAKEFPGGAIDIRLPTTTVSQVEDLMVCELRSTRAEALPRARAARDALAANAQASVGKMGSETSAQTMSRLRQEVAAVKARYGCVKLTATLRGYKDFTFATDTLYSTPPATGARDKTIRCYYDPGETTADAASRASQAIRYAIAEEEKRRSAGSGTDEWRTLYRQARSTIRTRYKCNPPL